MTRARVLPAVALLLVALAGCTDDPVPAAPRPGPSAAPPAAAADTSCEPRQSLRPTGAPARPGGYLDQIRERGYLVLGTSQDTPLFSARNPETGRVEGFDVDLGRQIAGAIFGDPDRLRIRVIPYDQRLSLAAAGIDPATPATGVDIVARTMTMTCDRWRTVNFSTVYYDAGQRVLVAADSPVRGIDGLRGKRVCAATGSTSLATIAARDPGPVAVARPTFPACLVAFQQNEVEAISSDDTILAGLAAQDPYTKVVGPKFTSEPYGVAMPKDDDLTRFVNAVLERGRADGTWARTSARWLGRAGLAATGPPRAEYRP